MVENRKILLPTWKRRIVAAPRNIIINCTFFNKVTFLPSKSFTNNKSIVRATPEQQNALGDCRKPTNANVPTCVVCTLGTHEAEIECAL